MDNNILQIYTEKIYIKNLKQFEKNNSDFLEYALVLKKDYVPVTNWNCDTFNTLYLNKVIPEPMFNELNKAVLNEVKNFAKSYGIVDRDIVIKNAWINVASEGCYQEYHKHEGSHFSAVYYINSPEEGGEITFVKETPMLLIPGNQENYMYKIHPNNCDLIIFKSDLPHMVNKNKSKQDRASIAFNFMVL